MKTIRIGKRTVGAENPTFVIAEVGINHAGDAKTAELLIREAAQAGADAVKFQTYVTDKRVKRDSPIHGVLKQAELAQDAQRHLQGVAHDHGLVFFSTPFDDESADFLERIDVPAFKIASFDIVNLALVAKVASYRKPMIVSRGMATKAEIDRAIDVMTRAGAPFALLHCVSSYPTPPDHANLAVIRTLLDTYDCPIGYSDHTLGADVPVYAVAAGARIIEKHFTLDRSAPGPDHALSADPEILADMVRRIRAVEAAMGNGALAPDAVESGTLQYRRPS